ncbi:MAG TPA: response regulator [Coleofasciculaceae cyanobacterium]
MSVERSKKPKMLVVDDEPDNLDLLYRTFRRDFSVLRAESGVAALEILATEGEVAVIISDQRMPEMKGTEFLSKTVPQFPDTMRIILTGFTDVEDLVEAINSGQVYKYITKPWDPHELKVVVQRATETYELLKQRTEELRRAQAQTTLLSLIVQIASQVSHPGDCLQAIARACSEVFAADYCLIQDVEGATWGTQANSGTKLGTKLGSKDATAQKSLIQEAIATQKLQLIANVAADPHLSSLPHYANTGIQSHLVAPILFRNQLLAVLSLQWKRPFELREDELTLISLAAQQIALVLACG